MEFERGEHQREERRRVRGSLERTQNQEPGTIPNHGPCTIDSELSGALTCNG